MHLVFLNQYYPPDAAPTGVMLEAVVERLVADGHRVTVLCAEGGYAGGAKLKAEILKTETENVQWPDAWTDSSLIQNSKFKIQNSTLRIVRIGATSFGRGSFVGKVADYFSYYLGVAWRLLWLHPRPDRIVALTTPPYLSVLARVFSKLRGGDHAHWVMDLYPDVMVAHGMLRAGGLGHRVLAALARWGFGGRRCAAILSLGPDMAERVGEVIGHQPSVIGKEEESCAPDSSSHSKSEIQNSKFKIHWVPLWSGAGDTGEVDGMAVRNRRHEMGWADDEMIVMYSGNMGLGHRFGEILEVAVGLDRRAGPLVACLSAAALAKEGGAGDESNPQSAIHNPRSTINDQKSSTRFVFFGGGKRRGEIEAFVAAHPEAAVELHDYASADVLPVHLRSADVHLASLAPEWTGTMVPSKLQGIFAAGRPVIFIGSAESSIGRWVIESGGGWVVAPGDVGGLRAALAEAAVADQRAERGDRAAAFSKSQFDLQANVAAVAARFTAEYRRA